MNRGASNSTNFQAVHGNLLQCNICKYTLLATRKYLVELHITRRHEGKLITYQRGMFGKRKLLPNFFLNYRTRRIDQGGVKTAPLPPDIYRFTFIPCWKDSWRPIYANHPTEIFIPLCVTRKSCGGRFKWC